MQSKKQSLIEASSNTVIGFGISYISTFIIFPLVGLQTSPGTNLMITIYFTIVSILRGYILRRYFNRKTYRPKRILLKKTNGDIFKLYCFHCKTDQPAIREKGKTYCANCGLRHNGFNN